MKTKRIRNSLAAIASVLALSMASASCTHTPPFRGEASAILASSIAEERHMILGGEEQYVLVRGKHRTAPILIFLHGGPGTSAMAFNRIHNSELEDHFVFVNWDQRGTGKSLRAGKPGTITLSQITADLDQLVDALRTEFGREKVLIIGHSWGSMLGLHYTHTHPDKVSALIGIGQMAQTLDSEIDVYTWALKQAVEKGDDKSIDLLERIGAPPYDSVDELMSHRSVVSKYGGSWRKPKSNLSYALEVIRASEFAWPELRAILRGGNISLRALFDTFNSLDAFETYPEIRVPVFFFEGRYDKVVSPKIAAAYMDALIAPKKEIVWFEQSAHSPQWEEPEVYNQEILRVAMDLGLIPAVDVQAKLMLHRQ